METPPVHSAAMDSDPKPPWFQMCIPTFDEDNEDTEKLRTKYRKLRMIREVCTSMQIHLALSAALQALQCGVNAVQFKQTAHMRVSPARAGIHAVAGRSGAIAGAAEPVQPAT